MLVLLSTLAGPIRAEGFGLRMETRLRSTVGDLRTPLPLHLNGDRIESVGEDAILLEGAADLRKGDLQLTARTLLYSPGLDELEATGDVRLRSSRGEISGPRLRLRVEDQAGIFESPSYELAPRLSVSRGVAVTPTTSRGHAAALRFEGPEQYRIDEGTFTTCKPSQEDWFVRASRIDLDFSTNVGEARYASLNFKGYSTPALPWASFPLNDQRKSGFLPPTMGIQGSVGAAVVIPYYFNLAPNYDDTLSTRITERRGVQYNNEFRYLTPYASGLADVELLPHDPVFGARRYAFHTLNEFHWNGVLGGLQIDKASDGNYFRELSTSITSATQVYLPRTAFVTVPLAPGWTGSIRWQRYQTLQDPTSSTPLAQPYERVPQMTLTGLQPGPAGTEVGFNGDFVRFKQIGGPGGDRLLVNPSLGLPWVTPGAFFKPKIQLHATEYHLEDLASSSDPAVQQGQTTQHRVLPIVSVDSGLIYERPVTWGGEAYSNTLEPRLFYVNIPYRNQASLPIFDSGIRDFNYSTIFSEYYYSGSDRISDANQLTAALTSRLIRDETGQELVRGFVGERIYFEQQRVILNSAQSPSPSTPRTGTLSSVLLGVAGQVTPKTQIEVTGQFASVHEADRLSLTTRYQPEVGHLLNLGYRYSSAALNPVPDASGVTAYEPLRQVDASGQWPVFGRYYLIGRLNYSIPDRRAVESVFGFEYNGDCWVLRLVTQSFVTGVSQSTRLFFLQLELNGVSKLGTNPLEVLKRSVYGYTPSNSPNLSPSMPNPYGQ